MKHILDKTVVQREEGKMYYLVILEDTDMTVQNVQLYVGKN